MAILTEVIGVIGVAFVGALGAIFAGGLFEFLRALTDPKRGPLIRHRSLRENLRIMLS